ncbi:MAG TPA: hypothetical protein VN372_08990, partial [Methanospirillum sp.]|nr:hypothetical protein [Methanospirillum sp.]
MDFGLTEIIYNPALIFFIILTIGAFLGRFIRMWSFSLFSCALLGALFVLVGVTVIQIQGSEEVLRYYITAHYRVFGLLNFTLRDI